MFFVLDVDVDIGAVQRHAAELMTYRVEFEKDIVSAIASSHSK